MGLALDFGRLFVIRGELQTALDSCALSAARELDGQSDALVRASSAGRIVGNANAVNFQSASWAGGGQIIEADLQFLDRDLLQTAQPAQARYARCRHEHAAVGAWLLPALQAFWGGASPAVSMRLSTQATATRLSAQTACPLPIALRPVAGQYCGVRIGDRLGTPGSRSSVGDAWNLRFGLLKNNPPAEAAGLLDATGYAYTARNWPSQRNALRGARPAGAHASAANYQVKSAAQASCADTSSSVAICESITGLKLSGAYKSLVPPGSAYGGASRIVVVPVVDAAARVIDYACMLMLQPMSSPMIDVQLEYIGNAGDSASPCTTVGLPGGSVGPRVATLVR